MLKIVFFLFLLIQNKKHSGHNWGISWCHK